MKTEFLAARDEGFDHFKRRQATIRERKNRGCQDFTERTFDEFRDQWGGSTNLPFIEAVCRKAGVADPLGRARQIFERLEAYPYCRQILIVEDASLYRHVVQDRKVDRGDTFDRDYLVGMVNMDILVTDDAALKELASLCLLDSQQVLSTQEFLRLVV